MDTSWLLVVTFTLIITYYRAHSTDDSIYFSQLNKCLANINEIPANISAPLEIKREKNHIELVVNYGQIDYYELDWRGSLCYRALGLTDKPIRTEVEQEACDNYQIGEKMDFYNFQCAFNIYDDKNFTILFVDHNDAYFINKETRDVEYKFYEFGIYSNEYDIRVAHDQSDDTTEFLLQFDECFSKKDLIPNNLPISFEFTKRNSHIELLAQYENVSDYFEISWEGKYCYRALGVNGRPNRTRAEQITECDHRPLSTNWDYGNFKCGFDVWTPENENYFIFYITQINGDGAQSSNAYIINKSTNKVRFHDFPNEFLGRSIFERYKEIDPEIAIGECLRRVPDIPKNAPIQFDLQAHDKNAIVIFNYQNKFDYFELDWNSSVRYFSSRLDVIPEYQVTTNVVDDCINDCEFKCPLRVIKDEEYYILVVGTSDIYAAEEAYVYFINKVTFDVNFVYYPEFFQSILQVPSTTRNKNSQFNSEIDSCVNRRNLLPESLAPSVNISRVSDHIQIVIKYDNKFDYYGINYKGLTCYVDQGLTGTTNKTTAEAVKDCDLRRPTECIDCIDEFQCGFQVFRPENDHFLALVIQSDFNDSRATYSYSAANMYLVDELTDEIHFRKLSPYNEDVILVPQTESDKNQVYLAEFEECLNLKNALPNDISIEFNITKVNSHLNILVYDNGKYDYYELNGRGQGCNTAVRMDTDPTRTAVEQMDCDSRRLYGSLKPYSEDYKPQFKCGYEVSRNDTFIFIFIRSPDGVYSYEIDRTTGKTELYLYAIFNEAYDDQVNKCAKRKYLSDFKIPLEVTKKPKDLADGSNYLEILVKHNGEYDLYVTEESGHVRHTEHNLTNRPHLSLADYTDKIECRRNTYYRVYHIRNFHCPLKVIENESYVNISINAFHYENVYVVDKSTSDVKRIVVKDNLILSNLPIPDADMNYSADMDECINQIQNTTNSTTNPFPVYVHRQKDFLEIIVKFNETFDVYKTTDDGREMCKISFHSEELPSETGKALADVHPDCVSCDGPGFAFTCPSVKMDEDESVIRLDISHGPGYMLHSYTLNKLTGELMYVPSGVLGPPQISNTIKSLIG